MSRYPIDYIAREAVQLPGGGARRGPNAESNAVRALLADGLHPGAWLVFHRNGKPTLEGSVTTLAARTWADAEADPAFPRWRPHLRQNAAPRVAVAAKNGVARLGVGNPPREAIGAPGAGGAA